MPPKSDTKKTKPAAKSGAKPKGRAQIKRAEKAPLKAAPPTVTRSAATSAGFVAILGAPNAGKSTLLNKIIGQKVSIVSPKVQTTRMRVLGVMTEGDVQIGFIDTPGIFTPKRRLDHAMVHAAWNSLQDADAILLMVDASVYNDNKTGAIVSELRRREKKVILVLNKIDALPLAKLLPLAEALNDTGIFTDTFMVSALTGDGVEDLKSHLKKRMPKSPWFYAEDQLSDLPSQLLTAEITREQLYRQLQEELPYAATVVPESWELKNDGSVVIRQSIVVSRVNYRPIVLGKAGARIKTIGQKARLEMEQLLGQKVHLFLDVKVDEKWQERPEFYRIFGLDFTAK